MGDPKFARRKYKTPSHPWQGERILAENELVKKYGLKNKKEIWRAQSYLGSFREQARRLVARRRAGEAQANKEMLALLARLERIGILPSNSDLDDILGLGVEEVLGRRLQTLVYMKGLANSAKQARQFIVHGHVAIDGRKVTVPGYIVKVTEEDVITYSPPSPLQNELHPMRPRREGEEQVATKVKIEFKEEDAEAPSTEKDPSEASKEEAPPEAKPAEASKEEKPKKKAPAKEAKAEGKEAAPAEEEASPEEKPAEASPEEAPAEPEIEAKEEAAPEEPAPEPEAKEEEVKE